MATAKTKEDTTEAEEATTDSEGSDEDARAKAKAQAAENLKRLNEARAKEEEVVDSRDFSRARVKQGGANRQLRKSNIKVPDDFDFSGYGPAGFAAIFKNPETGESVPITGEVDTQEFFIDEDKALFFWFMEPGQNLPKKRHYTVKGLHKDGTLVQLPAERQVQNNAGGDDEDLIGLRRYQRKGILVLIDWETHVPLYCAAWGCFAQAEGLGSDFPAFCSMRHAKHTLPNQYKDAAAAPAGFFGDGATTSRTWSAD